MFVLQPTPSCARVRSARWADGLLGADALASGLNMP